MSSRRHVQITETIQHLAGEYLAHEASKQSLITVTRAEVTHDLKNVTVYLSVLPDTLEKQALEFAKRSRSEFRLYIREHSFLHPAPTVDFEIDYGEKNRQRIDELTRK